MKLYRETLFRHRRAALGLCLLLMLTAAVSVAAGYSLGWILEAYEAEGDRVRALITGSLGCLGLFSATLLLEHIASVLQLRLTRTLKNDLRATISRKLSSLSYDRLVNGDTGSYVSWLQNDAETLCANGLATLFNSVAKASIAAFSFAVMTASYRYLGLASLVLFALNFALPQLLSRRLERAAARRSAALERCTEAFKDTVMGAGVLCLGGLRRRIGERIAASSDAAEAEIFRCDRTTRRANSLFTFQSLASQIVLMLLATYAAITGAAPLGVALSVGNLCGQFFNGVRECVQCVMAIRSTKPLWKKFEVESGEAGEVLPDIGTIELEDVSFAYGDREILSNRSMVFRADGKYAILGESGSGKTTLLKLILGLLPDYRGRILYDGREQKTIQPDSLCGQIAYVDQQVYLFQDTLRFNITLGQPYTDGEVMAAVRAAKLEELVDALPDGLETAISENGKNLSGGQRQRIALARALIRRARLILLDEGTSALDDENALDVEQSLMESPHGVILITHNLRSEIREQLTGVYTI